VFYIKRLSKDLKRWTELGWVSGEFTSDILDDARKNSTSWTAAGSLAILGAVLISMAAISFVASNWIEMSPIVRMATILASLWLALLGAGQAFDKGNPVMGHALALLGAALFGIAIMLTAQTFNMSSFKNTALLIWALAAMAIAYFTPSRPVLILSTLLSAYWVFIETDNPFMPDILWLYLIIWCVTAYVANALKSLASFNLLALGLLSWISHLLWTFYQDDQLAWMETQAALVLITGALTVSAAYLRDKNITGSGVISSWSGIVVMISGFSLQWPLALIDRAQRQHASGYQTNGPADRWADMTHNFSASYFIVAGIALAVIAAISVIRVRRGATSRNIAFIIILSALSAFILPYILNVWNIEWILALRLIVGTLIFALAIALIILGAQSGRRFIGTVGIISFIAQTLHVYQQTFSNLLDTALFFLIGGLLLFATSSALMYLKKKTAPPTNPPSNPKVENEAVSS